MMSAVSLMTGGDADGEIGFSDCEVNAADYGIVLVVSSV